MNSVPVIPGPPIPAVAAVNAAFCVREGGHVVPRIGDDGGIEYWCVGGRFDGQPVIPVTD